MRGDLCPGQQAVQAAHALQEFNVLYPNETKSWFDTSNTLAFLRVDNERQLEVLVDEAGDLGVSVAAFREPDRDNELTAIALAPEGKRLTRKLRLALS